MNDFNLIVSESGTEKVILSEFFNSADKALEYADQIISRKPVGIIYKFSFFKGISEIPYMETYAM